MNLVPGPGNIEDDLSQNIICMNVITEIITKLARIQSPRLNGNPEIVISLERKWSQGLNEETAAAIENFFKTGENMWSDVQITGIGNGAKIKLVR